MIHFKTVRINRSSQKELDTGIAELKECEYELKSTHAPKLDRKNFNYSKSGNRTYDTYSSDTRHIAGMTRFYHG